MLSFRIDPSRDTAQEKHTVVTGNAKVAIVGLNVGINGHIPAFRVEGFDVVALGAEHREKVEAAAKEHNVGAAYDDYGALLQHPGLDAVVIATPPSQHLDMAVRAFEAGKHVLIEKPFAMSTADAATMRDKARSSGKTAMIAEAYRFGASRAYVKELIEQGYIGDPKTVAITVLLGPKVRPEPAGPRQHWRSSNSTGGGFSAGPASTFFDSVLDWFGDVSSVSGKLYKAHEGAVQPDGTPADADEALSVQFQLANGAWGTFTASAISPFGQGAVFDLMGTEGTLRIVQPALLPSSGDVVSGGRFDDGPQINQLEIPAKFIEPVRENGPKIEFYRPYQAIARAFGAGMASGTSPSPNFEDAYKLQRITDAIRESDASGRWATI